MLVDTPAGRGIIKAIDDATQEATIRLNDAADGDPAVRFQLPPSGSILSHCAGAEAT